MKIYRQNTELIDAPISDRASERKELMVEHSVSLDFELSDYLELKKGDRVVYNSKDFFLNRDCIPTINKNTNGYKYDLAFYDITERFKDFKLKYTQSGVEELDFTLTTSGDKFLDTVISCLAKHSLGTFTKGVYPSGIEEIHFENIDIFSGLNLIAETYDLEWWIDGQAINLGKCEHGTNIILEYDKEIDDISFNPSTEKLITRLYAFGSTRNLPNNYRTEQGVSDAISQRRLRLPEGTDYIDLFPNLPANQVIEGVQIFEDIYPRQKNTIVSVESRISQGNGVDTQDTTIYTVKGDNPFTITQDDIIAGKPLMIAFQTGKLAGREFELIIKEDKFEIKHIPYGDNNYLPNTTLKPEIGNEFFFYNFKAETVFPSLIPLAENELLTEAENYLDKLGSEFVYDVKTRSIYCELNNIDLEIGQKVSLISPTLGTVNSRIRRFEKNIHNKYECEYKIGDSSQYSRLAELEAKQKNTSQITALKNVIETTFKDGIITEIDFALLTQTLKDLKREKDGINSSYLSIYDNSYLTGTPKTELKRLYTLYVESYNSLIQSINSAIDDRTISESEKDDVNAKMADYATKLENYREAERVANAVIYNAIYEITDGLGNRFISKTNNDTAQGLITFLRGISVEESATFLDGLTSEGLATFLNGISVKELAELTQGLEIGDYTSGLLGGGAALKMNNGISELEVDKLTVRMMATFFEIVVSKISHIGGQLLLTPARMKCIRVEELTSVYRCYFDKGENGEAVNEFQVGDQARCQVFTGSGTKFYWRLVTAIGTDYIELSKTDKLGDSIPAIGDDIVQLGHRTNKERRNAIILSTVGDDAPSWKQYEGINSFSLEGKETTVFSSKGNRIQGETVFMSNGYDLDEWGNNITGDIQDAQQKALDAERQAQQAIDEAEANVGLINTEVGKLQAQIDGEVSNWFYPYSPTLANYPASEWTANEIKDRHIGDTFTNTAQHPATDAGKSWRFLKIDGIYKWDAIADSDAVKALLEASKAQSTADGKSTTFLVQPSNYDVGDMWVLGSDLTVNGTAYKQGDLLTALIGREVFRESDWVKRVRYTDDTAIDNLEIGGRNLIPSFRSNQWTIGRNATIINDYEISFTKSTAATLIDIPVQGNKEYTISLFVGVRFYLNNLDENKGTINTISTFFSSDTDIETQYITYTFRSHSDAKYIRFRIIQYSQQLGAFPSVFRNIKIETGNKPTDWTPAPEDVQASIDEAIIKATFWSINLSSPVIYKDAINASTSGAHSPVTVKGELHQGTDITNGGFITVTPNGGTEPATATASPVTIAPTNTEGKTSYTVKLYDTASKTTLLDTQTIPVVFKGASGVNAINASLSNEADVLPASPEGVVSDYSGSGTEIKVFEGATQLAYGTGNGKFQVSASGVGITVGTASTVGNTRVYGVASNMTLDNATLTFTISGKTASGASFSLTKVQTFAKSRTGQKGDTGANAPLLYLSASAQIMKCNADNTVQTGQTITVDVKLQNVSGIATFSAIPYNDAGTALTAVTLGGSGNTRTLKNVQWLTTYKRVEITATLGALIDKITVYRVNDGATGLDGKNAIVGLLTNESITLPASSTGVVSSFANANGEFHIFNGTTKVTTGITFSKVSETGCTATINSSGVYSVTAMGADSAIVKLRAVYLGVTIDKVVTLSKSRTGDKGDDGKSITLVDVQFAVNTSPSTPPVETSNLWKTLAEPLSEDEQLWTRTKTTYSVGNATYSTPANITPKTGTGIESITEEYYLSSSKTEQTDGSWVTDPPTWINGWYIWTRSKIVYKNPASTVYVGLAVSSEWEAVNELEIGGRNLLLDSKFILGNTEAKNWERAGQNTVSIVEGVARYTVSSASSSGRLERVISLEKGVYTVSIKAKTNAAPFDWRMAALVNAQRISEQNQLITDNFSILKWTFEVTATASVTLRLYYGVSLQINDYIDVEWYKLEKGNKATDWTPAPEDVQAEIAQAQADANTAKAKTQYMTKIDGGVIYSGMMKLHDAGTTNDESAGISGIVNNNPRNPAIWTGGTYDQAIGGTAKAIIRHDGSSKFTDTDITGTVNATEGNIGGFSLENMGLLSQNNRFLIDALNGAIYLMNENGDVKTSIIPNDLPSTPEAFFAGSGGGSLLLTALGGIYNDGQTKTTDSFTVDVSGGKQFSLSIPEIKCSVNTKYTPSGGMDGSSFTTIHFELMRNGQVYLTLGQPMAFSTGGWMEESFTIPQRTIQISSSGTYSFRARVVTKAFPPNHSATGGAVVPIISYPAEFIAVVNRSQIGNNGMIIASSTTRYDYMVGDKHIIRRGKYGFRITENGLEKSSNMDASTPTWQTI